MATDPVLLNFIFVAAPLSSVMISMSSVISSRPEKNP